MKHRGFTRQTIVDAALRATADELYDLVNAELTLQETGGSVTTDGTEQTLYINNAPLGIFRPVVLYVDLDAMLLGDTTVFRVYYRIAAGGGLQLIDYSSYAGADGGLANSLKLIAIDLGPVRYGVMVTIQRTVAGDRAYPWEVFVEA
jgi:hypothetical protein